MTKITNMIKHKTLLVFIILLCLSTLQVAAQNAPAPIVEQKYCDLSKSSEGFRELVRVVNYINYTKTCILACPPGSDTSTVQIKSNNLEISSVSSICCRAGRGYCDEGALQETPGCYPSSDNRLSACQKREGILQITCGAGCRYTKGGVILTDSRAAEADDCCCFTPFKEGEKCAGCTQKQKKIGDKCCDEKLVGKNEKDVEVCCSKPLSADGHCCETGEWNSQTKKCVQEKASKAPAVCNWRTNRACDFGNSMKTYIDTVGWIFGGNQFNPVSGTSYMSQLFKGYYSSKFITAVMGFDLRDSLTDMMCDVKGKMQEVNSTGKYDPSTRFWSKTNTENNDISTANWTLTFAAAKAELLAKPDSPTTYEYLASWIVDKPEKNVTFNVIVRNPSDSLKLAGPLSVEKGGSPTQISASNTSKIVFTEACIKFNQKLDIPVYSEPKDEVCIPIT